MLLSNPRLGEVKSQQSIDSLQTEFQIPCCINYIISPAIKNKKICWEWLKPQCGMPETDFSDITPVMWWQENLGLMYFKLQWGNGVKCWVILSDPTETLIWVHLHAHTPQQNIYRCYYITGLGFIFSPCNWIQGETLNHKRRERSSSWHLSGFSSVAPSYMLHYDLLWNLAVTSVSVFHVKLPRERIQQLIIPILTPVLDTTCNPHSNW